MRPGSGHRAPDGQPAADDQVLNNVRGSAARAGCPTLPPYAALPKRSS